MSCKSALLSVGRPSRWTPGYKRQTRERKHYRGLFIEGRWKKGNECSSISGTPHCFCTGVRLRKGLAQHLCFTLRTDLPSSPTAHPISHNHKNGWKRFVSRCAWMSCPPLKSCVFQPASTCQTGFNKQGRRNRPMGASLLSHQHPRAQRVARALSSSPQVSILGPLSMDMHGGGMTSPLSDSLPEPEACSTADRQPNTNWAMGERV